MVYLKTLFQNIEKIQWPQGSNLKNNLVVICTLNRPRELEILIRNLTQQTSKNFQLLVVSGAPINESYLKTLKFLCNKAEIPLNFMESPPSLTRQRNLALDCLDRQVETVTFLDDDIILPKDTIENLEKLFHTRQEVHGFGALTLDVKSRAKSNTKNNDLRPYGKILKNGTNFYFHPSKVTQEVQWLPGCFMSFRADSVRDLRFDISRAGVGWGEDVDFSARVAEKGILQIIDFGNVLHAMSNLNRDNRYTRILQNDVSRIKLGKNRIASVSVFFVVLSILLEILFKPLQPAIDFLFQSSKNGTFKFIKRRKLKDSICFFANYIRQTNWKFVFTLGNQYSLFTFTRLKNVFLTILEKRG